MEFAAVIRWLQLGCGCAAVGALSLLLLVPSAVGPEAARWRNDVWRASAWVVGIWLLLHAAALSLQAASVSGRASAAWDGNEWRLLLERTRFGAVWMLRAAIGVVLVALLLVRRGAGRHSPGELALAAVLAVGMLCSAAWAGHAAAFEPGRAALAAAVSHLLAAGLWAGGLPWLLLGLRRAARASASPGMRECMRGTIARFSALATVCVVVLLGSGATLAYLFGGGPTRWPALPGEWLQGARTVLEAAVAPLLSTDFGHWVLAKLLFFAVVLWLAAAVRWRWMPSLASGADSATRPWRRASRSVLAETIVVAGLLFAAANAASTTPAAHDTMIWPLPFRVSVAATWDLRGTPSWAVGGVVVAAIGLALGLRPWARIVRRDRQSMRSFGRALVTASALLAGAAVTTWALSVPAYPETYLRSTVPYDAVSITRGLALYGRHCAVCHGVGGRGDGPRASTLSRRPVDLSEPHTALHTAGDIFHWLTYGKAGSPMPGFAGVTTADDRWDLINFLRAFSQGYQARILSPQVVAGKPWLGAPDFEYVDAEGRSGSLKSLRGGSVLLVFYTLPSSRDRLLRLARWHAGAAARDLTIVAVALPGSIGTLEAGLPFVLPVDGAAEAVTSYLLLRRTIADPGRGIIGEPLRHLEFLVDRSGYLRARWRPDDGPGWDDEAALSRELTVLRDEPPALPPPDDHVH